MRAALDPNGADAYWAGRFGLIPLLQPAGGLGPVSFLKISWIRPSGRGHSADLAATTREQEQAKLCHGAISIAKIGALIAFRGPRCVCQRCLILRWCCSEDPPKLRSPG